MVCKTEPYATIAFKSCKFTNRKIISKVHINETKIQTLNEISDNNKDCKRNNANNDNFIKIQLKK